MVVAMFLLLMEEEDAFWMTTAVIEELLPPSYYSPSLIGVQVIHLQTNVNKFITNFNFELPGGSDGPSWFDSHLLALGGRSNARTRHRTLSHYSQLVSYT